MKDTVNDKSVLTLDIDDYDIPEQGSLGLLALGYQGIMAWRLVRKKANTLDKNE